jgi:starch phosphorylase
VGRGRDHYLLLADYASYLEAQLRVDAFYSRSAARASRAIANVDGMGELPPGKDAA